MARTLISALIALASMLAGQPAHAADFYPDRTIELPTYGTPAPARIEYTTTGVNGRFGYVIKRSSTGSAPFVLIRRYAETGLEDFDIFFYVSLDLPAGTASGRLPPCSSGEVCAAQCTDNSNVCTGTIPAGTQWVIVTLTAGRNGRFTFSA